MDSLPGNRRSEQVTSVRRSEQATGFRRLSGEENIVRRLSGEDSRLSGGENSTFIISGVGHNTWRLTGGESSLRLTGGETSFRLIGGAASRRSSGDEDAVRGYLQGHRRLSGEENRTQPTQVSYSKCSDRSRDV